MSWIDYTIIASYLGLLLAMSWYFKAHATGKDFFLGGRQLPWQALSLSVMATQLSAVSFISAPAFVGIREGGGLIWLSYELALPMAIVLLLWRLLPTLHRSGVVSIYDFLEQRFDTSTRVVISLVFQISRSFATAIMIYAMSLILQATMGIEAWISIVIIGVTTLFYSAIGGMKAVVFGDAAQMVLIVVGAAICMFFAVSALGGFQAAINAVDPERFNAINVTGVGASSNDFGLLPMIFGGLILYASYYGCDQSEAQRSLSSKSITDLKKVLLSVAFMRFPITILYCFAGLFIGALVMQTPSLQAQIPSESPDWMMPVFMLNYLPSGILGILVVAIMAAAMSSLSSAINSLSAVSLEDIYRFKNEKPEPKKYIAQARITGVFWGLVTLLLSLFAGDIAPTVIEAINKIGSVFYGPILAVFLLAMHARSANAIIVNIALILGVGTNVFLWLSHSPIFWFWWNLIGFSITVVSALLLGMTSLGMTNLGMTSLRQENASQEKNGRTTKQSKPILELVSGLSARSAALLIGYSVALVFICLYMATFLMAMQG